MILNLFRIIKNLHKQCYVKWTSKDKNIAMTSHDFKSIKDN